MAKKYRAVRKQNPAMSQNQKKKKYSVVALYAFGVIALSVLLVFLFKNYGNFSGYIDKILSVLSPIMLGALFAYLLNPLLRLFEKKVFTFVGKKSGRVRGRRIVSVTATYIVLLLCIAGFFWLLVPQIISGYKDLSENMSAYIDSLQVLLTSLAARSRFFSEPLSKITDYLGNVLDNLYGLLTKILPSITSAVSGFVVAVKNSLLGLILSVYFLLVKEELTAQCKKFCCAVMKPDLYIRFLVDAEDADRRIGRYLIGNIISSVFVGVICFIGMAVFGMPYYPLISLIVGITNIIPVFGPIIGGIIGAFILFIARPIDALWFIILIIVIQQIDGNYICPKIFGSATGLSPVWVMIAITVMSGFFGFIGMLFGVPIFAVVYYFIKDRLEKRLSKKGYAPQTEAFIGTETGRQLYYEKEIANQKKENSKIRKYLHKQSERLGLAVKNTISEIDKKMTTREISIAALLEAEKNKRKEKQAASPAEETPDFSGEETESSPSETVKEESKEE